MNAFEVPGDGPVDLPIRPREHRTPPDGRRPYHSASARISLIGAKEALAGAHEAVFDEIHGATGGHGMGAFHVLLHSPQVARRTALAGDYLRGQLSLPHHVQQLAILATAQVNDCPYLLAHHASLALQAGAPEEAMAAVVRGSDLDGVAPAEAQGIGFTPELLMANRVSEATFQSAADRFGLQGLVQLTALIGYYGMMACVLNAFEVPPVLRPAEPG